MFVVSGSFCPAVRCEFVTRRRRANVEIANESEAQREGDLGFFASVVASGPTATTLPSSLAVAPAKTQSAAELAVATRFAEPSRLADQRDSCRFHRGGDTIPGQAEPFSKSMSPADCSLRCKKQQDLRKDTTARTDPCTEKPRPTCM